VEFIRSGYKAFGVVCVAADVDASPRKIASFDDQRLLLLGRLEERREPGRRVLWAKINGRIDVSEIAAQVLRNDPLAEDLRAIEDRFPGAETQRKALVDARLGQGMFRARVIANWGGRCAVTGCGAREAIRASHIKAWRESTDVERLDAHNGLPLVASLDALFDAHLISFEDDGGLLVSTRLKRADRKILLARDSRLLKPLAQGALPYMREHRRRFLEQTS
jgi:putative restriction endonuclease